MKAFAGWLFLAGVALTASGVYAQLGWPATAILLGALAIVAALVVASYAAEKETK